MVKQLSFRHPKDWNGRDRKNKVDIAAKGVRYVDLAQGIDGALERDLSHFCRPPYG
tara:strand:+ start:970 stop:1137 length:168 start_codon:yes stop_codon:yes gene_type:complete